MTLGDLDLLFEDITDEKSGIMFFREYISSKNKIEAKNKFSALGEDWNRKKEELNHVINKFNQEVFKNFNLSSIEKKID
jgi:hypothetical protein